MYVPQGVPLMIYLLSIASSNFGKTNFALNGSKSDGFLDLRRHFVRNVSANLNGLVPGPKPHKPQKNANKSKK